MLNDFTTNRGIKYCQKSTHIPSSTRLLLLRHLDALPETLHLELLASCAAVDVLDVVGGGLEVAGGVVALGDEDVVLGARLGGLVDRNGRTLESYG